MLAAKTPQGRPGTPPRWIFDRFGIDFFDSRLGFSIKRRLSIASDLFFTPQNFDSRWGFSIRRRFPGSTFGAFLDRFGIDFFYYGYLYLYLFVSFRFMFVSFRFRFVSFRFVSFRFVSFRFVS